MSPCIQVPDENKCKFLDRLQLEMSQIGHTFKQTHNDKHHSVSTHTFIEVMPQTGKTSY